MFSIDSSIPADLSQKPGRQEAEQHSVVSLTIKPRHADVTKLPQLALPGVQRPGRERHIDQNNIGTAFNKPPPKVHLQENGETGEIETFVFKVYAKHEYYAILGKHIHISNLFLWLHALVSTYFYIMFFH